MNKFWESRLRVFLVLLVLCIFAAVKVVDVYVSQEAEKDVSYDLTDISKRSLGKLTVDAMKANIQEHVVEPIIHRIKREIRDYSTTTCQTTEGGECRRNDQACGGTFQGGADCDLGLSDVSYTGSAYHECCNAAPFVPVDGLGNPVTGTAKEVADATLATWTDTGLLIKTKNSLADETGGPNCDDGTDNACSFWSGGMKAIVVNGLNDRISTSGCTASKMTVTAAAEISHTHSDFGPGITAQNGFVVRLEGAGRCFGNWVIDQFAVYSDLTSAYVETDGSVIYQQLDTRNKIFDIAFLPNLD